MCAMRAQTVCEVELATEVTRPLGNTLRLLARRLDGLLLEGGDEGDPDVKEGFRSLRALTTDALHNLWLVTDRLDAAWARGTRVDRAIRLVAAEFTEVTGGSVDVRA